MTSEYKTTGNRTVYNRLRKRYLSDQKIIGCSWCNYHRLENRPKRSWTGDDWIRYDWSPVFRKRYTTWKRVRRHQWDAS